MVAKGNDGARSDGEEACPALGESREESMNEGMATGQGAGQPRLVLYPFAFSLSSARPPAWGSIPGLHRRGSMSPKEIEHVSFSVSLNEAYCSPNLQCNDTNPCRLKQTSPSVDVYTD